jgi:hypothetical protein
VHGERVWNSIFNLWVVKAMVKGFRTAYLTARVVKGVVKRFR